MDKRITIWYEPEAHSWIIMIENSPVLGAAAWQYTTWRECLIHADVLRRVWNHL